MPSNINATITNGVVISPDNSGVLQLQSNNTTIATISSSGLTMNTGSIVVASSAAPAFSAVKTSNQSLTGGVETKVTFDTEQFDTNNNFASSRFTPTVAGYYQLSVNLAYTNAVSGYALIALYKNGSKIGIGTENQLTTASYNAITASYLVYCNGSTDYVEVYTSTNNNAVVYGESLTYTYFQGFLARSA